MNTYVHHELISATAYVYESEQLAHGHWWELNPLICDRKSKTVHRHNHAADIAVGCFVYIAIFRIDFTVYGFVFIWFVVSVHLFYCCDQ